MKGIWRFMKTTLLVGSIVAASEGAGEGGATRLVRFESKGNPVYGIVEEDKVFGIVELPGVAVGRLAVLGLRPKRRGGEQQDDSKQAGPPELVGNAH